MDKEMTYKEFVESVYKKWEEEAYSYGSMQFPAAIVRDECLKMGITNAKELYEQLRKEKGDYFYYTGD